MGELTMIISNYSIKMGSEHYALSQKETSITNNSDSKEHLLDSKESESISTIETPQNIKSDAHLEIEQKMAKALLRSLHTKDTMIGNTELVERYVEAEALHVNMEGVINSESGSFSVAIEFSLSRSFLVENQMTLAQFSDPLVINLKGDIPQLSEATFKFDIDNDGESDQISQLQKGNGFLALDKNSNGLIDDGSELFGSLTGNGFMELNQYDSDANGWIDENDPIFEKLRIWVKNEDEDHLIALGEVGIGAIFLGDTQSDFTFKTLQNESLGRLRASSMVLFEDGRSGIISQIDFAKKIDSQTQEKQEDIANTQKAGNAFISYSQKDEDHKEVSFEPDAINKKIALLQKQFNTLKERLGTTGDKASRAEIRAQMSVIQGQIIALFAAAL
jgi:hypothetical protein